MFDLVEEKARLRRQKSEEAIALAMKGRWKEAIAVNQSIIEVVPTDVDAYNRLGKAYMELGEFTNAKEAYNNTLELDKNNSIARKNLTRILQLEESKVKVAVNDERPKATPSLFIGEVGKAGVVSLYNLAPINVLAKISAGDQVNLKVEGHHLHVENEQGEYLGTVDNQHGFRLAKLIDSGNKYAAAVVSLDTDKVRIQIREVFQHPDQAGRLSFPAKITEGFQPHVKDSLLRQGEEEETLEEDEGEDSDLEEGEMLPEGFSIFEAGTYMDDMVDDEMRDEE